MSLSEQARNDFGTQENLARLVHGSTLINTGKPYEGFTEIRQAYSYFHATNDVYNQLQALNRLVRIGVFQLTQEEKWANDRKRVTEEYIPQLLRLAELYWANFEKLSSSERSVLNKSANLLGTLFSSVKQYSRALTWLNRSFDILSSLSLFGTAILLDGEFRRVFEATNDEEKLEAHKQRIIDTAQKIEPEREQVPWPRISAIVREYTSLRYANLEHLNTKKECLNQARRALYGEEPEISSAIELLEKGRNLIDRQDLEDIDIDVLETLRVAYFRHDNSEQARTIEKELQTIKDIIQARDFLLLADYYKANGGDYVWALKIAASVRTKSEYSTKARAELGKEDITVTEDAELEVDDAEDQTLKEELLSKPASEFEDEDCYLLLQLLEREFRNLIIKELSKLGRSWWRQRIPPDVRTNAQRRKQEREKPYPGRVQQNLHVSNYLDFSDYEKIILMKINWVEVFEPIFARQDTLSVKMGEIRIHRNDIAHMRELPLQDREVFVANARALLQAILQHNEVSKQSKESDASSEEQEIDSGDTS